ncbi:unnamed protein product, partial [Tilletia laevis]
PTPTPTPAATAIYLVDTPGHIDFTIEVERALRVVDGCVVVLDGVEGVEAQTEGVWRQAARYGIQSHIVFINKLDRAGASVPRSLLSLIQRNLHSRPVLLQLPVYSSSQGEDESLTGLIDLLHLDHLTFNGNAGETIHREPLSPTHPLFKEALKARSSLIETLAEQDEDLLEQYLEVSDLLEEASTDGTQQDQRQRHLDAISPDIHLRTALRRQTIRGSVIPVLCGAAAKNTGVQPLLDAVAWYLPSPIEAAAAASATAAATEAQETLEPVKKHQQGDKGAKGKVVKQKELAPHERELAALAFKVVWDKRKGPITFVRVYSGTLSRSSTLFNTTTQARERLSKVFLPFADQYVETPSLRAGQIGVLMGLRDTRTGDTLIDPRSVGPTPSASSASSSSSKQLRLRPIHVPPPVFSMSIEPESKSDEASVSEALSMLVRTDPSLRLDEGGSSSSSSSSASGGSFGAAGTGQTVLSGMGELHLEIARERLANEFGVRARMGSVRVSYRETLDENVGEVVVEETWEKELGGKKLKVGCTLTVRRLRDDEGEVGDPNAGGNVVVVQLDDDGLEDDVSSADKDDDPSSLDPETVRQAFTTGLIAALSRGPLSSNPLTNLHLTLSSPLLFGPDLSPPRALSMAAGAALRSAMKSAAPSSGMNADLAPPPATAAKMMEPVMRVRIECDAAHMGKVVGDLTADQAGTVVDVEQPGNHNDEGAGAREDGSSTTINVYIPPDDLSSSSAGESRGSSASSSSSSVRTRTIVHALVPLARLVSYSSRLRALTGGMGTFTMELHGFAQTSREREREILRELGKAA